jgi:hypothetical protein
MIIAWEGSRSEIERIYRFMYMHEARSWLLSNDYLPKEDGSWMHLWNRKRIILDREEGRENV